MIKEELLKKIGSSHLKKLSLKKLRELYQAVHDEYKTLKLDSLQGDDS